MKTTTYVLAMAMILLFAIGTVSAVTPPSCDFNASVTTGPEDLTVTFTASYQGITPPVTYEWDFGDNSGAVKVSGNTITHTYLNPGKYSVRLAVNDLGIPTTWWVSNTKTDYIFVTHIAPTPGFMFTPSTGNAPLEVTFTDETVGEEYTLAWDFGDGTQSTDTNPVHTYTVAGEYTIALNATNDGGSNLATDTITVNPPLPEADFTATSSTTGAKPFAVQFENRSTYEGTLTGWTWQFGDGGSSIEQNPLHVYTVAGTYNVSLTVTSISGDDTETKAGFVTVLETPVVCPTQTPTPEPTLCPVIPNQTFPTDNVAIFRPSTGYWYIDTNGDRGYEIAARFGGSTDIPVPGDYNGNGIDDIAIFRPSSGYWYIDTNRDGLIEITKRFGGSTDTPKPGDYNGDGQTDIAIFRPSTGYWYIDTNLDGAIDISFRYGGVGDVPLIGDWN